MCSHGMITPPSVDLLRVAYFRLQNKGGFFSGFEEKISESALPAPFTGVEPAGQWLSLLHLFFSPCPTHNAVCNCESQPILEAAFQHLERHFLPMPAPCDG